MNESGNRSLLPKIRLGAHVLVGVLFLVYGLLSDSYDGALMGGAIWVFVALVELLFSSLEKARSEDLTHTAEVHNKAKQEGTP